ncbi:MAG: NADH-quinone oxidoreductase subunit C [Anaerolineales bacterium]|nr:NADH-quinone oxidoreductase subunit C [Anaerolineales bacterium]
MKTTEEILAEGVSLVEGRFLSQSAPEPDRIDLAVEPGRLLECIQPLASARWGFLAAITGLDPGPESGRLEVLYQFCNKAAVLTFRVSLPRDNPVVPSIYPLIPASSLFERELMEMFGVVCEGTPDPRRLFLSDDWPEETYPLRKDYIVSAPPPEGGTAEGKTP